MLSAHHANVKCGGLGQGLQSLVVWSEGVIVASACPLIFLSPLLVWVSAEALRDAATHSALLGWTWSWYGQQCRLSTA